MNEMEEIETLWRELENLPFPRGSRTHDLTVDLAGVDAYASGCIYVFTEHGTLDEKRIWILRNCLGRLLDLRARCNINDGAEKAYIAQLLNLSQKVLKATRRENGR